MSIDHDLKVDSDLCPEALLVLFWDCLGLDKPTVNFTERYQVPYAECPNFHGYAGTVEEPSRTWNKEDFGVASRVSILFNVPYEASLAQAKASLVRGTMALLKRIPDDLFLQWDGGTMFLIRRQGKLYVNRDAYPPLKALVDLPYEEIEMAG